MSNNGNNGVFPKVESGSRSFFFLSAGLGVLFVGLSNLLHYGLARRDLARSRRRKEVATHKTLEMDTHQEEDDELPDDVEFE